MATFEISGNLDDDEYGLKNFKTFMSVVCRVREYYEKYFGTEYMNQIRLFVDNATEDSGYTPITTPILGEYITIKLGIKSENEESLIAYQFAHELMHFVFFIKFGLGKERADIREESICTAASLIYLYHFYKEGFTRQNQRVKQLSNEGYRSGAGLAESVKYDFGELIKFI